MRKIISAALALVIAAAMAAGVDWRKAVPQYETAIETEESIVVLHTSDVHGAVENYAAVAALKQAYEAEGDYVLLLDAGDFSMGTPEVGYYQGLTATELMEKADYDAAALGNHEFDYGKEHVKTLMSEADFPILSANIRENGASFAEGHTVFTTPGGKKIGVFALNTPEASTSAHPAKVAGLTFLAGDELISCAQGEADTLKAMGCQYVICLSHLGINDEAAPNRSFDIAEKVNGVDLFIDGHSHSSMDEMTAATNAQRTVNGAVLASNGTKLETVGVAKLKESGFESDEMTMDEVMEYIKPYMAKNRTPVYDYVKARAEELAAEMGGIYKSVFAKSEVELNGKKAPEGNRDSETNNGDLIADAMLWKVKKTGDLGVAEENMIAVTNGGGIRAAIAAGDVTRKDINTVLPFGNTLCVAYVKGSLLLEALEASTFSLPDAIGAFPQCAGIEFTVDCSVPYDQGESYPGTTYFAPASIGRVTINSVNGRPFDPEATYAVVTNDFCAAGGDTYYSFIGAGFIDTGVTLDEAVIEYISQALGGVIGAEYATPQGRITIVGK